MNDLHTQRIQALSLHLVEDGFTQAELDDIDIDCEHLTWNEAEFNLFGRSYLVMTEEERDTAWDERLESYLDECVLPELPSALAGYFDSEAWKRDARHDGAGHALSSYDGEEHEYKLSDASPWLFIFRTN